MKILLILALLFSMAFVSVHATGTSKIKPIVVIAPQYPNEAALSRIEGYVEVEFTVDVFGSVKDIFVVKSEPENIFDQAAMQAVLKYKFSPQIVDNIAIEQVATQRIEFKLPENFLLEAPSLLELLLRNKPTDNPFIAIYDLQIDSKDKDTYFTEVMVVDSQDEIEDNLLVWQNKKATIPNFALIQDKVIKQARSDFLKTYGAFNQYQKLCLSNTCPPLLLTKLNSLPYKGVVDFIKLKVSLTINNMGEVVSFKVKNSPRKYKNSAAIQEVLSQLKFLPSTENNKPVSSTITATIKAITTTQKTNFYLWGRERLYHADKKPEGWIRVATIIDKKGKVIDAKVIDSSDSDFESEAINAVKKYIFPKGKTRYQLVKTISFNKVE